MDEREQVRRAALYILQSGLVKGTWGNVSLLSGGKVYITPSGVPYDELEAQDIAVVDLESGDQIEGRQRASSELPMHLQIYRDHKAIQAIVHVHSIYATAFACMRKPIPCYVEDQAMILGGSVQVAEYALPGTWELAKNASKALGDRFAVLLSNHGAVAVGRSMKEALVAAQILEKSAQIAYLVGENGKPLEEKDVRHLRKVYIDSYSRKLEE